MITVAKVKATIDISSIPPEQRNPIAIFDAFDSLKRGESLLIIHDQDPQSVHYRLTGARAGQFDWDYLQEGPRIWRVLITRT